VIIFGFIVEMVAINLNGVCVCVCVWVGFIFHFALKYGIFKQREAINKGIDGKLRFRF